MWRWWQKTVQVDVEGRNDADVEDGVRAVYPVWALGGHAYFPL